MSNQGMDSPARWLEQNCISDYRWKIPGILGASTQTVQSAGGRGKLARAPNQGPREKLDGKCPVVEERVCLQGLPGCSLTACAVWGLSRSS